MDKITDLKGVSAHTDFLMFGNDSGCKGISFSNLHFSLVDCLSSKNYKLASYRSKNLGSAVTDEQWEEIRTGRFRDMFLGDFWVVNDIYWVIIDFDYWYNVGGSEDAPLFHHVVVQPSGSYKFGTFKMNNTATNEGGYLNSSLRSELRNRFDPIVHAAFGSDHIGTVKRYFQNAMTSDGSEVAGVVYADSTIDLPCIENIFGSLPNNSEKICDQVRQFSLYRMFPERMFYKTARTWTANMVNKNAFFVVTSFGPFIGSNLASDNLGVRPVFALKA